MQTPEFSLDIQESFRIPKYKQLIKSIITNIELGKIKCGEKLPSINELSIAYLLSRDTVEKAYRELKARGIIESVKGKGFYVCNSSPESKMRVLILFNKISSYKKLIYNSLAHYLGNKAHIDFFIYHCNFELFSQLIKERLIGYDYYVLMPHFTQVDGKTLLKLIKNIPPEKLIFLDKLVEGVTKFHGAVYQDFKMDIFNALQDALHIIKKYPKLILVFPENANYPYPREIIDGFRRFCAFNHFQFQVLREITESHSLERNTAYIIIEETDLASLIKHIREKGLSLKKDIGILSYNDTPLKEVLEQGISVITTNFEMMGKLAAKMILNESKGVIKNEFRLIDRNSL